MELRSCTRKGACESAISATEMAGEKGSLFAYGISLAIIESACFTTIIDFLSMSVDTWSRAKAKKEEIKRVFRKLIHSDGYFVRFSIYAFAKRYGSGFQSGRLFLVWDCFRFFLCFSI